MTSIATPVMVQVAAPATLSEGFKFDAMFDGKPFTVTVPEGGVTQGQVFAVPFVGTPSNTTESGTATGGTDYPSTYQSGGGAGTAGGDGTLSAGGGGGGRVGMDGTFRADGFNGTFESNGPHHIPKGQWRDGIYDCCILGPFHPSLIMAIFCHSCLNAQIMTRLRLTFLGEPSLVGPYANPYHWQHWRNTFKNCVTLIVCYGILQQILAIMAPNPNYEFTVDETTGEVKLEDTTPPTGQFIVLMNQLLSFGMASYTIITLIRARYTIRQRYHIPEHPCLSDTAFANRGIEDCMLSICCTCCTVAQMARHTADYAHGDNAMFCTSNGLAIPERDDSTNITTDNEGDGGPFPPAYAPHSIMVV